MFPALGWRGAAADELTMPFTIASVSPLVFDQLGGQELALAGTIPTDHPIQAYLGPLGTTDDPPCYGGEGNGYSGFWSEDGATARCVAPPTEPGAVVLTLVQNGVTVNYSLTVVAAPHQTSVLSLRRDFPPWSKVGPRRLDLEPRRS